MLIALVIGGSLLICPLVPRKHYKWFGLFVSLILAYCAFHIDAYKATDLYRHFEVIDLYRIVGYDLLVDDLIEMRSPLSKVIFYLFSFVKDNRWFPAVCIFVIYQLIFGIVNMVAEDEKLSQKQLFKATAFILINFSFFLAVYSVRMWIVFAVFAYTAYIEAVRKKKRLLCWLVYIVLVFFHSAALLLVLSRVAAFFIMNPPTTLKRLLSSIAMVIIVVVAVYYTFGSSFGANLQDKYESYLTYDTRGTWQTIDSWIRAFAVFCLAIYQLVQIKDAKLKCVSFVAISILIIMLVMTNNYQVTLRFPDGLILLSIPLLATFTKPHRADVSYPLVQLILIGATILRVMYFLIFEMKNLIFVF